MKEIIKKNSTQKNLIKMCFRNYTNLKRKIYDVLS